MSRALSDTVIVEANHVKPVARQRARQAVAAAVSNLGILAWRQGNWETAGKRKRVWVRVPGINAVPRELGLPERDRGAALRLVPALMMKQILDVALPGRDFPLVPSLAGLWVAPQLVAALLALGQQSLTARIAQPLTFNVRTELCRSLQRQSLRFFTETKAGENLSRLNNDVGGIQQTVRESLIATLTALVYSAHR